jgi:hypothetical protein
MYSTYGVVWREGAGPIGRGKLELHPFALQLDGLAGAGHSFREILFTELALVRVGRSAADRIAGRTTLILELNTGEPLAIASVSQPGVIGELAERIAALLPGRRNSNVA